MARPSTHDLCSSDEIFVRAGIDPEPSVGVPGTWIEAQAAREQLYGLKRLTLVRKQRDACATV